MNLVSGIIDSGFFAQSALSADVATKDSLGRNISETYLTGIPAEYATTNYVDSSVSGKYDTSSFSAISGNFLTAVPADYATTAWVTGQGYLTAETDWTNTITAASAHAYNEATAQIPTDYATTAQLADKLDSQIYAADSGNFLTALPSDLATTGDIADLAQSISETYQPLGDYMTADALTGVSSTWNTVTAKLDSTAFSTVSGNFLTAHQSLTASGNWDSTYTTVSNNSANWLTAIPVSTGEI